VFAMASVHQLNGDGPEEKLPDPERRGYLMNEYTGAREYFVLRGGVLRIRQSPRGEDSGSIYLAHGSSVTLLANNVLEVRSRVPYVQEYILAATSEHEAEGWHDAIQAAIQAEQSKVEKLTALLESGCTMHKYNYSNSKRSRRYFWVADSGRELCWGRSKGEDTQKVNLRECIGIIYGPMTTTFQRCTQLEDASWSCFSLLFMGRTLDLAVAGDLQVHAWFLGMQHLISRHGIGSMPMMSDAQLMARKVQLKLTDAAHRKGLVLGRFLVEALKALAAGKGLVGLGPGAVVSGGRLATPLSFTTATGASGPQSAKGKKDRKRDMVTEDHEANDRISALHSRVLQLQGTLRERSLMTEAADVALKKAGSLPEAARHQAAVDAFREVGLQKLRACCGKLEEEQRQLSDAGDHIAPQVKAAEKTEKSLRKMQAKFEEIEVKRTALEKELDKTRASSEAASGARASSQKVESEAKSRGQELQRKVAELERKLNEIQGQKAEAEATQNKKQAEAIANAEQERLALAQKLEDLGREFTKKKDEEAKSRERLLHMQDMQKRLGSKVAPLSRAVKRVRDERHGVQAMVKDAGKTFGKDIEDLTVAIAKGAERIKVMEDKYTAAMEQRKMLHNQVLDLKGNIRVFVRVRPINEREKGIEPAGEATIGFTEDTKLGIYDGQHARRKWFEFDQVFAPNCTQVQVFEEAAPLATSALDGYNVCVFAYGQTGSGKTHTMTGIPKDPGLNTRVLTELFRIREERSATYDLVMSIAITEIYNETIRDLLSPSGKKLDVKMNSDGSSAVPGLTEVTVGSLEEVLKCIADATKNRSTTSTDMNEQSSRSHSIVTVKTACTLKGSDTYIGKIHLIDLAGSENVSKSGAAGDTLREAQNINKSLSALGDVISSLVAKNSHTPYRNSKLTMMLKDSLGGDSKTLMIVCCSPAQTNVTETLSSLNFASRARNVELGKAKRNVAG